MADTLEVKNVLRVDVSATRKFVIIFYLIPDMD